MNPYSGTSSLAQVMHVVIFASLEKLPSPLNSVEVQVLRISAASFGFVYGGVKLGYLKVSSRQAICTYFMATLTGY